MKIYKEDYKHFRTCQKLAWFLNDRNFSLAQSLINEKKILNFVELTNTLTSTKLAQNLQAPADLIFTKYDENSTDNEEDFYYGETLADGIETGELARQYFMNKYRCFNFDADFNGARNIIFNDLSYEVFFEPRFEYKNCITKCDILKRNGGGWDLIEVKAVTWVKEEHMWDLLYQYDILTKCGINVTNVYLMYLNNEYILKDQLDLEKLFIVHGTTWKKTSKSKKSFSLYDSIRDELITNNLNNQYHEISKILNIKDTQEIIEFLTQPRCHSLQTEYCPHIFSYFDSTNTIFELYRLRKKKKALWYYNHNLLYLNNPELLPFVLENKLHLRQYEISVRGEKPINYEYLYDLKMELKKYKYPIYMYDFETMKSAIPKFYNTRPYQQIPFQYSVHVLENQNFDFKNSFAIKHYEFIADGESDPRVNLVENLCMNLLDIHGVGTYVAYNQSFEKSIIKSLSYEYKKFEKHLQIIYKNTIDLQDFFKNFKIYKSDFRGSLSIKKTLPAFDKNFSYEDLQIKKGDMASEAFRRRVENNISLTLWNANFRDNMLKYCARDTLGMVVLFWHVNKLINEENIKNKVSDC